MLTFKDIHFDLKLLSKYRTELMGTAIIGVLIMHFFSLGEVPSKLIVKLINIIPILAFTETFLFLSGLGIYYSLSQCSNVLLFYKKRIKRLIIPYLIMAFVPFFLYVVINEETLWDYICILSTIRFWCGDGHFGMWYIAVTIMLYVIAPWLYKCGVFDSIVRLVMVVG